jgi:hypothetical protein
LSLCANCKTKTRIPKILRSLQSTAAAAPQSRRMQSGLRCRGKSANPYCHSERSEESLFRFSCKNRKEIFRFAQNDRMKGLFRTLFSRTGMSLYSAALATGLLGKKLTTAAHEPM